MERSKAESEVVEAEIIGGDVEKSLPIQLAPSLTDFVQLIMSTRKPDIDPVELQALSTRHYLEKTVVPVLILGLQSLVREKPPKPIEYLAAFLIKNRHLDRC
ncbi:Protein dpy-30 [Clonorchis sinensis]|uniref:Protein dpy-30 n=2 Tax=Clonorchis sinensis TaxID=79923 RepID=A0A8T1MW61_CLOSI|nr:Protein dpy-30 [Clonorchis sinensis]